MDQQINFIHLRTYTDYSLGFGAIKIKELVKSSLKLGYPALAITDKNNLFGSLEYAIEAAKSGLQPIIGIDITIEYKSSKFGNIILISKNEQGYNNLMAISSMMYLKRDKDKPLFISIDDLIKHKSGLIAIICGPKDSVERISFNMQEFYIFADSDEIISHFGDNVYIELIRHNNMSATDIAYERSVIEYAYQQNVPIVATNSVAFLNSEFHEAQDSLMCIINGRYIAEDDRPKVEESFYLKTPNEMQQLFADLPEALENSVLIAMRCSYFPESRGPLLPKFASIAEAQMLEDESLSGLQQRFEQFKISEDNQDLYLQRLHFELKVINKMQYPGYFLIVSDFIRWSKKNSIPVGPGRGSGAGSIVAWALDITDLDPIKFGLLFERFLNPDRVSMPDFDIDFCQERRSEVIKYVQDKYGYDRVAQIITYGKLQARAVLRDVGRVLQMPYNVIDKICKMVPNNPANPVTLSEAIALDSELKESRNTDSDISKLLDISLKLEGLNRHVSTHAAGIVIADRPISQLAPLYLDANSDMPAVQYSMKYAESAGLIKFDFLGLKTLTVISWSMEILRQKGIILDISSINLDDKATYELLSTGNTVGIFQFESSGMRDAIKKLKPDSIGDLIALGSLYRPGPMDNIPSYINRKHGVEKAVYFHPLAEDILKETYGIIVYQEQVMEIAKVLAGFSLGEADLLRRAMGKKIKAEMEAQKEGFINGCIKNNINASKAAEIFALIEKFASYGFNKSHAAAYAMISYQTAYLKANYIKEFLVASINSEIHDTDKINLFIEEAKKFNVKILLPNINLSESMFCVEDDAIRFGLAAIKNVGLGVTNAIVSERRNGGLFTDIYDFINRLSAGVLNKRSLENIILSGCLDELETNRSRLFASAEMLLKYGIEQHNNKHSGQFSLFDDHFEMSKPHLHNETVWSKEEALSKEFLAFGFYLSDHPVLIYEKQLRKIGYTSSTSLESYKSSSQRGAKIAIAGVVISSKVKSSKRGKYAFIQLSDPYGLIEVSIFNESLLLKSKELMQVGVMVFIKAEIKRDVNGARILAEEMTALKDAIKNVTLCIEIEILEHNAAIALSKILSTEHIPGAKNVLLKQRLSCGSTISFKSKSPLYLLPSDEERVKQISGIIIND